MVLSRWLILRDELAAILFTSGSTGAAKGVLYEHGMFLAQVERFAANMELKARWICRCYQYLHFLISTGHVHGGANVNPSRPASVDPEQIVRAIQQNSLTNSFGSPALWTKIASIASASRSHYLQSVAS